MKVLVLQQDICDPFLLQTNTEFDATRLIAPFVVPNGDTGPGGSAAEHTSPNQHF